jgi:hypothetical protein
MAMANSLVSRTHSPKLSAIRPQRGSNPETTLFYRDALKFVDDFDIDLVKHTTNQSGAQPVAKGLRGGGVIRIDQGQLAHLLDQRHPRQQSRHALLYRR